MRKERIEKYKRDIQNAKNDEELVMIIIKIYDEGCEDGDTYYNEYSSDSREPAFDWADLD